ncbi:hypothetical protein [Streptomyces sp. R1]|nr:hypothetical protein [Streptomyces sp. R1]
MSKRSWSSLMEAKIRWTVKETSATRRSFGHFDAVHLASFTDE